MPKMLTADKCASKIPNTMNQILSIEGEKNKKWRRDNTKEMIEDKKTQDNKTQTGG